MLACSVRTGEEKIVVEDVRRAVRGIREGEGQPSWRFIGFRGRGSADEEDIFW